MRKISIVILLTIFTLAACAPVTAASPTATAAPSATSTPTATATATETPTPEVSVDELVRQFELTATPGYENRTFAVEQRDGATLLVDQYNKVPKLVKSENGSWRELDLTNPADAEIMYGELVPQGGGIYENGFYIYTRERHAGHDPVKMIIAPNVLGDWEVETIENDGEQIRLYHLLGGLRDVDGTIHIVRVAWDSPDITPEHASYITCRSKDERLIPPGNQTFKFTLDKALKYLRPGEPVGVDVWEGPGVYEDKFYSLPDNSIDNNAQMVFMEKRFNKYFKQYILTPEEWAAIKQGKWPSRIVTLIFERGPVIQRESTEACYEESIEASSIK